MATVRYTLMMAFFALLMTYAAPTSAQMMVNVDVEIATSISTADQLNLVLRGSRLTSVEFNLGSGFIAGTTEVRTFTIPKAHFCEFFSYRLTLTPLSKMVDDWAGTLKISLDGSEVWNGPMSITSTDAMPTGWRAGGPAYDTNCGDPTTSSWGTHLQRVDLQITTGTDGTISSPTFALQGAFSAGVFPITLVTSRGYMPGTTITHTFYVPLEACQINGFSIHQWEDPWTIADYTLIVDGVRLANVTTPFTVTLSAPHNQPFIPPHCP